MGDISTPRRVYGPTTLQNARGLAGLFDKWWQAGANIFVIQKMSDLTKFKPASSFQIPWNSSWRGSRVSEMIPWITMIMVMMIPIPPIITGIIISDNLELLLEEFQGIWNDTLDNNDNGDGDTNTTNHHQYHLFRYPGTPPGGVPGYLK